MDSLMIHAYKIHAIKKHKRHQFVATVLLYTLSTLACTLLCSSPLWYPPFCATYSVVFFIFIPKIFSFFFTSKVLFIVGNLIVIFLVGESKFFTSKSKDSHASYGDICYNKYRCKIAEPKVLLPPQAKMGPGLAISSLELRDEKKRVKPKLKLVDEEVSLPADELNKLADDFIARVNRQRRVEAEFCRR